MVGKFTSSLALRGFYQALGVAIYCLAIGFLMFNIASIIGPGPTIIGPAAFLVLFIVSALTCSLIVFYYPYKLFFAGKKKEALDLVVATTAWLAVFFVLFITSAIFLRQA